MDSGEFGVEEEVNFVAAATSLHVSLSSMFMKSPAIGLIGYRIEK